jgi:hypothetical protein
VKPRITILPLLLIVLMMFALPSQAQKSPHIQNLPKFERRPYHFGFLLAVNQMNFALKTVNDYKQFDSLVYVTTQPSYGFCIGIVSQLRILNHFCLRFVPTLTFGDRSVEYTIKSGDTLNIVQN